jgi:hypothetical protein
MCIADDCRLLSGMSDRRRHPQSSSTGVLLIPGTQTSIGARTFAFNGPATLNMLPVEHCMDTPVETFAKRLKTHLMSSRF